MIRSCCFLFLVSVACCCCSSSVAVARDELQKPMRPALVQEALDKNKDIYYFGLGSNMSRQKLQGRALDGAPIHIQTMEAAVVPNYRLAFNLKGFPPLEPGMGSLEPSDSNCKALAKYHQNECHGALVKLSAQNYNRLMQSEGVGVVNSTSNNPSYEEIVVMAFPYRNYWWRHGQRPVPAIALRARDHVRLSHDPCPSKRYMKLLREGAKELGLDPEYQLFLQNHPVQHISTWVRNIALCNLVFLSTLSFRLKVRVVSKLQNWFLFQVYVPSNHKNGIVKSMSGFLTLLILAPGAVVGSILIVLMKTTGTMPPFLLRMMTMLGENHDEN